MPIDGQRVLDVGVAQGDLPNTIQLTAVGFKDASCTQATVPEERATPVEKLFRKGLVLDAALVIKPTVPVIETNCSNGVDDDNDGKIDCADLDCTDRTCSSGNICVTGQTCQFGTCAGGQQIVCTPPSGCFQNDGRCVVGVGCTFTPAVNATCNDGNDCTSMDHCDATGTCGGQARTCNQPPSGQCWAAIGACFADAGCQYHPDVGATCNDTDNCTVNDRCDVDAGCAGTRVTCQPRECAMPSGSCDADGGCRYTPFDAGMACGDGGACNTQGGCLPAFPFVPSNVAINDIPTAPSGKVTFNCGTTTIDTGTSGAPSVSNACPGQPPLSFNAITQSGGIATVVLAFEDLEISGGNTLAFTGGRPVIVVSLKDILVLGAIQVGAGAQSCATSGAGTKGSGITYKSGGGGGGFASAGGAGGTIAVTGPAGGAGGAVNLGTQLRGGCPGGVGGGSAERAASGGGALQLVAFNSITVSGVISAPGAGGAGGGFSNGGNGGGSGGELLLEAQQVIASGGGLTCNGGGGGEAGTGNNGQPGQLTTAPASGGTDNVLGGSGGAGAAGATAAEAGEGSSLFAGGGGGGGGVGRIRINVTNSCNIGPQVVISPAATSNKADAGCP
jgi:hypothetical protein